MDDNETAFPMGGSTHSNPPIWPPSSHPRLQPKSIVKNDSSTNCARMPSYSMISVIESDGRCLDRALRSDAARTPSCLDPAMGRKPRDDDHGKHKKMLRINHWNQNIGHHNVVMMYVWTCPRILSNCCISWRWIKMIQDCYHPEHDFPPFSSSPVLKRIQRTMTTRDKVFTPPSLNDHAQFLNGFHLYLITSTLSVIYCPSFSPQQENLKSIFLPGKCISHLRFSLKTIQG